MKVLVTGASGMVGQGVLRECLAAPDVASVLSLGRRPATAPQPKLRELIVADLAAPGEAAREFAGLDAAFLCAGVSSAVLGEAEYRRLTFDLTLGLARALVERSPGLTLIYVSGAGTDSSESGRTMWARVKGATENALLALPCRAYMFRPGLIRPLDGIVSRTRAYRLFYQLAGPLLPLLQRSLPGAITSTRQVGHAMLAVARHGSAKRILESADINAL